MLLGLVVGTPAHAAPPDEAEGEDTGLHLLREAAIAGPDPWILRDAVRHHLGPFRRRLLGA